jgi:hypothetical protein
MLEVMRDFAVMRGNAKARFFAYRWGVLAAA